MKKLSVRAGATLLFASIVGTVMVPPAQAQDVTAGAVVIVAANPQDLVMELDRAGRCGSR